VIHSRGGLYFRCHFSPCERNHKRTSAIAIWQLSNTDHDDYELARRKTRVKSQLRSKTHLSSFVPWLRLVAHRTLRSTSVNLGCHS